MALGALGLAVPGTDGASEPALLPWSFSTLGILSGTMQKRILGLLWMVWISVLLPTVLDPAVTRAKRSLEIQELFGLY